MHGDALDKVLDAVDQLARQRKEYEVAGLVANIRLARREPERLDSLVAAVMEWNRQRGERGKP